MIRARLPIQEYTPITPEWLIHDKTLEILPVADTLVPAAYLGPLGMPGLTAYSSVFQIGKPQMGETIFISAASGAVGQLVGQICKRKGLYVVGSVGTEAKLKLIKDEMGFDDGFVYVDQDPGEALTRLCSAGIDIYYDNVGGAQLEAAIDRMNKGGRIIISGMVSQYNKPAAERYGVRNLFQFVSQGSTMQGFQVGDKEFGPKWREEHRGVVGKWLETGQVKAVMSEVIGMERAAEAFLGMLRAHNRGKAVLKIWPGAESARAYSGFNDLEV